MVKKLMLAIAMLALVAAPAFASVQNVKVSGDLKTTSVLRSNFTDVAYSNGKDSQNVILSQVGLNIQADLTDNVSTMIRMTNERLWGITDGNGVNLDTAYVTMKEMLYSPLTVTVGRQPLAYGNQFLVGKSPVYNAVKDVNDLTGGINFDAVKAVLSYDPLTVDLFAAKVSEGTSTGLNDKDDANLFGINANYKLGDKMNTVVEAYTFAKMDKTAAIAETKKLYVPGLRLSTNPIEGLNVQLEGAYQLGNAGANETIHAYGLQGMVNYALPVMKDMKPVLSAGYTYLSGDKDGIGKKTDFQPVYDNQFNDRIFDAMGEADTNVKIAEVAFELTPVQDITTKLTVYNLSSVKKTALTDSSRKIGNEVDLDVSYAYTEDVKFGVSAGLFVPGKANGSTKQDNASQVLSSVQVLF